MQCLVVKKKVAQCKLLLEVGEERIPAKYLRIKPDMIEELSKKLEVQPSKILGLTLEKPASVQINANSFEATLIIREDSSITER